MTIDERHRDKNGEISTKHGNTLVNTLRKVYGGTFATGKAQTAKLAEVLAHLDKSSRARQGPRSGTSGQKNQGR